eukprot:EG_transcript_40956
MVEPIAWTGKPCVMNFKGTEVLRTRGLLEDILQTLEKGEKVSATKWMQAGLLPNTSIDSVRKALTGANKMIELHNLDPNKPPEEKPSPEGPKDLTQASPWW